MARLGGLGPRVAWPFFWLNRRRPRGLRSGDASRRARQLLRHGLPFRGCACAIQPSGIAPKASARTLARLKSTHASFGFSGTHANQGAWRQTVKKTLAHRV